MERRRRRRSHPGDRAREAMDGKDDPRDGRWPCSLVAIPGHSRNYRGRACGVTEVGALIPKCPAASVADAALSAERERSTRGGSEHGERRRRRRR